MLLPKLLNHLDQSLKFNKNYPEKEILFLFFMTILGYDSINQTGLDEKYIKRIYRMLDKEELGLNWSTYTMQLIMQYINKWLLLNKSYKSKCPIVISIDDTTIEKFGNKMEHLRKLKDYNNRFIQGYSLLSMTISIGNKPAIPFYFYWHKKEDNGSKIDYAIEGLKSFINKLIFTCCGLEPSDIHICFDSWYLNQKMCSTLNDLGVCWISKIKSNWKINAEVTRSSYPISQLSIWPDYFKITGIKVKDFFNKAFRKNKVYRVWHQTIGVFYATETAIGAGKSRIVSNMALQNKTMKKLYKLRWKIETMFRDLKQSLKIAKCYFVKFYKNKNIMEFKILIYALIQYQRHQNVKWRNKTTGQLLDIMKQELYKKYKKQPNLLKYIQLHIFNKTQKPFNAILFQLLRG